MVLHKCDNRACVRVDHLYVGTGSDNNRDAFERGRRANLKGADHPQSVVDLELLEVILALRAAGATYRYIATGLGMSVSTVWKAVNNPVPVSEEDA